jgi:hypothetical protein
VRALAAFLASLALSGCSGSEAASGGAPDATSEAVVDASPGDGVGCLFCSDATEELPDWVAVKAEIDRVCSKADNCHGSGAGEMGLSPGHEFGTMIDVVSWENPPMLRVAPGDPASSYVYLKLACEGGIEGGCMPFDGTPDPEIARRFHDWIEAGAPTQ